MKTQFKLVALLLTSFISLFIGLAPVPALALTNLTASDFSNLSQSDVNAVIQLTALGTTHRAYAGASPLGITGFDFGVDLVGIPLPSQVTNALSLATGQPIANIPTLIPLPKVNLHKGLPGRIDVGLSFLSYQNLFTTWGGDIKWTILGGLAAPALAVRGNATYSQLYFITTHTYSLDVVVSKNLFIIDPYLGAGLEFWSGDLLAPISGPGFSTNVSAHTNGMNPHLYAGFPLKLILLKLTPEVDYSTSGLLTYGGKLSIAF